MNSPRPTQPKGRRSKGIAPRNISQVARFSSNPEANKSDAKKSRGSLLAIVSGFFALFLLASIKQYAADRTKLHRFWGFGERKVGRLTAILARFELHTLLWEVSG